MSLEKKFHYESTRNCYREGNEQIRFPMLLLLIISIFRIQKEKERKFQSCAHDKNDHLGHYSHCMHPVRLLPGQGQCKPMVSLYPVLLIPLNTRSAHWKKVHKEQSAFVKGSYSLCEIVFVFHGERECITAYKSKQLFFSQDYFPDFESQIVMSEKHSKFHNHYYDSGALGTT